MTTFDSTKRSLPELLKDITTGKTQLPDFQRGWVWDDDHVQSLLVSIARSFPVGAVMLMETGGEVRFETRPVEGIDPDSVTKEAVCLVFEKVNTGGVQLSVFELITASYAAESYNLRDDWFGSDIRDMPSRKARFKEHELLRDVQSTDLLQAITLLQTRERKLEDLKAGKMGKQVRPVSAKRASVLDLPLDAYRRWADVVEKGFVEAAYFLKGECFFSRRELPYATQLVPLAGVMTLLGNRWREPRIHTKLSRWFWSGVLGELYGGSVDTRIALDLEELMDWLNDGTELPRTVIDASFDPTRLESLRSRNSAAYKGINVLILRKGAEDFFWKGNIQALDQQGVELDIHHIFPRTWCEAQSIPPRVYDSIINKTPISARTNRMIGGDAPSVYLARLQDHKQVQLDDAAMNTLLEGHRIPAATLRADDFDAFYQQRKHRLRTGELLATTFHFTSHPSRLCY